MLFRSVVLCIVLPLAWRSVATAQGQAHLTGDVLEMLRAYGKQTPEQVTTLADSLALKERNTLTRGVLLFRCAQLTGRIAEYERALTVLHHAVSGDSGNAQTWFAVALVRQAMGDSGFLARPGPLQPVGASWHDGAAYAYLKALEEQPDLEAAADSLAALRDRVRLHLDSKDIVRGLISAAALEAANPSPGLLLSIARVEARLGQLAEAQETYRRFLRAGGDTIPFTPNIRDADDSKRLAIFRADTTTHPLPEVLYRRLRLETDLRNEDSAQAVLKRYLAMTADTGVGLFFRSRLACLLGDSSSIVPYYFAGAAHIRSEWARSLYREDISWIADPAELSAFDGTPADGLSSWLQRFWNRRDVADAQSPGSRLREHCRRYFYSMEHYRRSPRSRTPAWWTVQGRALGEDTSSDAPIDDPALADHLPKTLQSAGPLVDDRGLVYMRHGQPDQIQIEVVDHLTATGIGGAVVWRYFRPTGDLILQFADVPFDGSAEATALSPLIVAPHSLCAMTGGLACKLTLPRGSRITASDLSRVRRKLLQSITTALTSDDLRPHFEKNAAPVLEIYGVGGDSSGGRLLAVFAMPAKAIVPSKVPDGYLYPLRIRLTGASPDGSNLTSIDTTRFYFVSAPLKEDQYLSGYLELSVSAGRYNTSLTLSDSLGRVGRAVTYDGVSVPNLTTKEIVMSDLILGLAPPPLFWSYEKQRIPLNPLNAWPVHGVLELFYEVGGLVVGQGYTTAIEIRKEGRPRIRVEFTEEAAADRQVFRRTIKLGDLSKGDYMLVVTLKDERHREVSSREQQVHVR